ncbi:MAG: uL15 family ribosomal protein, partial [Bacteroidaceae bacterium]|nr:uL15 family ribosomal protein [Bacteroidaceae bacterium]
RQRRLRRHGVKNISRVEYKGINLSVRQELATAKDRTKIGVAERVEAGFIKASTLVKILGNGTLTAKVEVEAHAYSKTAEAAITAAGGTATKL